MKGKTVSSARLRFQDPAMDEWVTAQTMNEVSRDLRENNQAIKNIESFLLSIVIGIATTYFMIKEKWGIVFILIIILVLLNRSRYLYLRRRRKELITCQDEVREICKSMGMNMPTGDKNEKKIR